jgi:hypothetical protein
MCDEEPIRVSRVQAAAETHLMNPLLRRVLRSPLHPVASRWTLLIVYVGRRSGRRFTLPVVYAPTERSLVVVTPRHASNWWKNFRTPWDCTVWLRGEACEATGEVVSGPDFDRLVRAYFDRYGILARAFGFDGNPAASSRELERARRELAVVRFDCSCSTGHHSKSVTVSA